MWSAIAESWQWAISSLAIVDALVVLITIPIVMSVKKEATSAVAWCLFIVFVPIFGCALLCHIRVSEHLSSAEEEEAASQALPTEPKAPAVEDDLAHEVANAGYEGLARIAAELGATDQIAGNNVTFFHSGQPAFDAIIAAIESAKHHVHLEFFIYRADETGKRLFDLLARKSREGVEVRILVDSIGSHKLRWWQLRDVRNAGVNVAVFLPMRLFKRTHVNLRNHRKIVVVDGKTAFTGGMNIGNEYLGEDKTLGYSRDTFLRVEGPAVDPLQRIFVEDWDFSTGESLKGTRYFPPIKSQGDVTMQVMASGPDMEIWPIRELYFTAAVKAQKRLWVVSPYFVPDQGLRDALRSAARSGVDVRLIIPEEADHYLAHYAGSYYLPDMMQAGVKVFLYTKGFLHAKMVLVDDEWASVGTANFDNRSLLLNFETTCLFHTPTVVRELEATIEKDLRDSMQLDPVKFAKRPITSRLMENFCRLFAPVL